MIFITDQVRFRHASFVCCLFVCLLPCLFFLFFYISFFARVSASNALKKSIREDTAVTIISWIEACISYSALVK